METGPASGDWATLLPSLAVQQEIEGDSSLRLCSHKRHCSGI